MKNEIEILIELDILLNNRIQRDKAIRKITTKYNIKFMDVLKMYYETDHYINWKKEEQLKIKQEIKNNTIIEKMNELIGE